MTEESLHPLPFDSQAAMLSIEADPVQVSVWVEAVGYPTESAAFVVSQVSGRVLEHLHAGNLIHTLGFVLLGDALRLLSLAQESLSGMCPPFGVSLVEGLCPVGVSEWLVERKMSGFATTLLRENICGRGLLTITSGELMSMDLLSDAQAVESFFQDRNAVFLSPDCPPTLVDSEEPVTEMNSHGQAASAAVSKSRLFLPPPPILAQSGPAYDPGMSSCIQACPSTPPQRQQEEDLIGVSPLKRRRLQTPSRVAQELSVSSIAVVEKKPFGEPVPVKDIFERMLKNVTCNILMLVWQDEPQEVSWSEQNATTQNCFPCLGDRSKG